MQLIVTALCEVLSKYNTQKSYMGGLFLNVNVDQSISRPYDN